MKKIVTTIIIFLFTVTMASYAESHINQTSNSEKTAGQSVALYGNTSTISSEKDSDYGGLYKAPADNPGGRPDNGGGIGQRSPMNDGMNVLIACCVILVAMKSFSRKLKKNNEDLIKIFTKK